MADQAATLGIVIVSYNTRQLTLDCLESLRAALADDALSARVWVVDNASRDGSAEAIRERFSTGRFPELALIESADNLGFAGGANRALAQIASEGEPPLWVLLLNPDTLVRRGALAAMVAFLQANPRAGAVGAQLLYGDGSFQHGAFHFPTLAMILLDFWPLHHRLLDSRLNGRYPRRLYRQGEPFPIDHPLGAALMARWETLRQVGWLDEGFFMYCEEIDWCLRAKKAGWAIYCAPQAQIVHLAGQSTRQFRERMFVALWRSRFRLFDKHYGRCYRMAARLMVRAVMRRETRRAQQAQFAGELSPDEAHARLDAYRQVREM
jgi:hypothetical protein